MNELKQEVSMKILYFILVMISCCAICTAQSRIAYCDFSQMPEGDVFTNCTGLEARGCDKNTYYKNSLRFLTEGATLTASFNVPEIKTKMELLLEHLSAYSGDAKNNGYSPVTVKINGKTVFTGYSPASHAYIIEKWDITDYVIKGENKIEFTAGKVETHYWLNRFEVMAYL